MHERERLQAEYDGLPPWAKTLLDALGKTHGYGIRWFESSRPDQYRT